MKIDKPTCLTNLFLLIGINFTLIAQHSNADSLAAIEDQKATTILQPGSKVPDFTLLTTDGNKVNLSELKGKTIFLNFFALSCPICMKELPELEKQIWLKYKSDKNVVVLCVGREETNETLNAFREKKKYTFPMAPDTNRKVYSIFGTKYIPRNIVIDKEGKLILTEVGYNENKLKSIITAIENDLNH
ncbi:MAG: TlpA disulfide reductase family protein [Bacteroidales bacterium]